MTDYFLGAAWKIPGWLVKMLLLGDVEVAIGQVFSPGLVAWA